ncbi:hypothetical protein ASPVEDRAFT_88657 [Aspergillus versicolor CBS 583.65]|uniref:Uncharacterized protein n=1 Tax=Aspergillus versicolor CBS 583.65 TaxID=1036611 RepID=A0A1L9Q0V3_ASPVE|nr:uncharacterized protein ASPVEDRAFT_88657 [Aspergillus versicolor CBS 583.65]OJJ07407.1 hypothetical protein ASPVEDRAFT_88657 [Aspergillus versicolor CBS 583.65]
MPEGMPCLMVRRRRNWTPEEDMILKREVRRAQGTVDNISWHEIAAFLPGRTNKDCRKRWYGTAAKVKKGAWTQAEDERLRRAIEKHGTKWSVVAAMVATRLPDQCSKRWSQSINPDIDHSPWTQQEDDRLLEQVNKHGHYWQQIVSLYFPGRTSLAAKNRYHILQRRLKSHQTGVTRVRGLSNTSWQEILWSHSPEFDSKDQDISSSSATPPDFNTLPTGHDSSPFVFDESCPSWLTATSQPVPYPTPGGLEVDSTGFPFNLVDQAEGCASFETDIPPTMGIDDFVSQAFCPESSPSHAPSFPSVLLPDTSPDEAKPDAHHRRVCIQVVCSSDKVGAIFEAVTKFAISAAIKTDD